MPTTYTFTSELDDLIEQLIENDEDHANLKMSGTTIGVLFHNGEGPLSHQGRAALATVKITGAKDRALGVRDAVIIVDQGPWERLAPEQQLALVDHELYHLVPTTDGYETDPENEELSIPKFKYDTNNRPKLRMREHDIQVGWFTRMMTKHGSRSMECQQMARMVDSVGQLLFAFGEDAELDDTPAQRHARALTSAIRIASAKAREEAVEEGKEGFEIAQTPLLTV